MKYYKLLYDYEKDDSYINCNVGKIGKLDRYDVSKGILITNWEKPIFQYDSLEGAVLSDYVANVYSWFIVSKTFFDMTYHILSENVQYLPVTIEDAVSGEKNYECQLINITKVLDAFDMDNSEFDIFELDDEKIISVRKYALKRSVIGDNDIFRLKGDTIPIFVSERVKSIIENNKLSGFDFLEVKVF